MNYSGGRKSVSWEACDYDYDYEYSKFVNDYNWLRILEVWLAHAENIIIAYKQAIPFFTLIQKTTFAIIVQIFYPGCICSSFEKQDHSKRLYFGFKKHCCVPFSTHITELQNPAFS